MGGWISYHIKSEFGTKQNKNSLERIHAWDRKPFSWEDGVRAIVNCRSGFGTLLEWDFRTGRRGIHNLGIWRD